MDTGELLIFIKDYREGRCNRFEHYYNLMEPSFKLLTFNDPSGILEHGDFKTFAMLGMVKAIDTFDASRWNNPQGWIYFVVRHRILKELRRISRLSKNEINSHVSPCLDLEEFSNGPDGQQEIITIFAHRSIKDIVNLYLDIKQENTKASDLFQLLLLFPSISKPTISTILDINNSNGMRRLFKVIRARILDTLD